MTDLDLFGQPTPPPRKTEVGYLEHLSQLDYPDGARFWSLAHLARLPPGLNPADHDAIWLRTEQGQMRHVVIEIATGKIIETAKEPA